MARLERWVVSAGLGAASLLAGCFSIGPDYKRPDSSAPPAFREAPKGAVESVSPEWWKAFGDPQLDRLIEAALADNQDLKLAAARVAEARALLGAARADVLPDLDFELFGSRSKVSTITTPLPPGFPITSTTLYAGANFSWEIDLWGRLRRATEGARAQLLSTVYGVRGVRLALLADVAQAYFDLRADDRLLEISRQTLDSRNEALRLEQLRYGAGVISELDLKQAEAELAATAATIPAFERAMREDETRLAVLLGHDPESPERGRGIAELVVPAETPAGLPSTLLQRRPDIAAAEQDLVVANAAIGIAKADYFPKIKLTGNIGSESRQLSDLFTSGTGIWAAAASIVQPLLKAPYTAREVAAAKARFEQAVAAYRKTIEVAFKESEDALLERRTSREITQAFSTQVDALRDVERLANLRYEAGSASYIEVLDAERSLFQAQLSLVRGRRDELAAAVALYKALGGGWEAAPAAAADLSPRRAVRPN